jgi:hypothetical protein
MMNVVQNKVLLYYAGRYNKGHTAKMIQINLSVYSLKLSLPYLCCGKTRFMTCMFVINCSAILL